MQHDQRATVLSLHRCKLCGNRLRDWDNTCLVRSTKVCTTWFRREPELPCLRIFALGFWELEDELAGLCVMTIRKNSWVTSFENSAFSYFGCVLPFFLNFSAPLTVPDGRNTFFFCSKKVGEFCCTVVTHNPAEFCFQLYKTKSQIMAVRSKKFPRVSKEPNALF